MQPSFNPYLNRMAIKDTRNFFGRRQEIATIASRIGAGDPQSISIIGERKIGKSSLLRALFNRNEVYLRHSDEYVFIYSDLQENLYGDVNSFFASIMKDVALSRYCPQIADKPPTYENFRRLAVDLGRLRVKLVLLLDEFDAITRNKNFGLEFFSFLRSLPNNYAVSYVITSAQDLLRYCHSREIAGSPFFNIFHKLNLGCFTREEATDLISRPSREAGHPLEAHAVEIFRLAGRFPFFLQLACCSLFEYLEMHPSAQSPDWPWVRKRFYQEARDHFQYLWDHLPRREQVVCRKMVQHQELEKPDAAFFDSLKQRGYVEETDGGASLFSDAFRSFLEEIELQQPGAAQPGDDPAAGPGKRILGMGPSAPGGRAEDQIGRFAVRKLIGSGAMGHVYLAEDTVLKRPVALKRISPRYREDSEYRERFLKEAARASQLSNPHIACIYDFLEIEGEWFLVMEYVDGITLRQRFTEELDIAQFLQIARQCSDALVSAHANGIVHCDIKPENIMLNSSNTVKILDFGVAKMQPHVSDPSDATTITVSTEFFGCTPSYAAPEYLLDFRVDTRSDIFSLGIVFYEALAHQHPFQSSSWAQTIDRILHHPPASLRNLNPGVMDSLEGIVHKCLEKRPEERYQNAATLADDLYSIIVEQTGLGPVA